MANDSVKEAFTWVGAVVSAVSALLLFLGFSGASGIAWLETNEPLWFGLGLTGFIVAAVIFTWAAIPGRQRDAPSRRLWVKRAFIIMIAGAIATVVGGIRGQSSHPQLSVENASFATNAGALTLDANVRGVRLKSDTRMVAYAD
jgi:hypothetical protein